MENNINRDKAYHIKPVIWFVRDEKSVRFHVQNDDYFGTVATILSLIRQKVDRDQPAGSEVMTKTLDNLEKDLMFLQKNYKISEKSRLKESTN